MFIPGFVFCIRDREGCLVFSGLKKLEKILKTKEKVLSLVMEMVAVEKRKVNPVLSKYEKSFDNSISILLNSRKGLKPQAVFDFISLSQFSGPLIEQLLKKTIKTFNNYKEQNTSLDAVISEKLLKLFALYDKGISVFGSVEEFNKWLGEAVFGLGYQVPREILDTITGIDLVGEELTRIEYGDLA